MTLRQEKVFDKDMNVFADNLVSSVPQILKQYLAQESVQIVYK